MLMSFMAQQERLRTICAKSHNIQPEYAEAISQQSEIMMDMMQRLEESRDREARDSMESLREKVLRLERGQKGYRHGNAGENQGPGQVIM